ncbi:hypothetical protein [Caulobacter sp. BP25]|nr:hypothetical protein [Caulobacter sp. BP25]
MINSETVPVAIVEIEELEEIIAYSTSVTVDCDSGDHCTIDFQETSW